VERHLNGTSGAGRSAILIVSPTKALANDLVRRLEPVFDLLGLVIGVRHGERKDTERASLPHVLITTPESLDVMLGKQESALTATSAVVLDEVHLLANTQRGLQLAICLHRLECWREQALQVVGLSATLGDPQSVWRFFRPGVDPVVIEDDSGDRSLSLHIRLALQPAQLVTLVDGLSRKDPAKILVFANSRRVCDVVAATLRAESSFGDSVFAHHSSLSRDERLLVEREFQERPRAICVATSTLELGIDIGDINLVVLWGVPTNWQSYLQRLGRANRRSKNIEALAVAPVTDRGLALRDQVGFQALRSQVEGDHVDSTTAFELYGAAAQQLVSVIHAGKGGFVGINSLARVTAPWPHLERDTVLSILDELVAEGVLERHPVHRRYGAGEGLWDLEERLQIWSNMPWASRDIEVRHGSASLGSIPGSNLISAREGEVFVFASRRWEVVGVDREGLKVKSSTSAPTIKIRYDRRKPSLDPAVGDRIRQLLVDGDVGRDIHPAAARVQLVAELEPLRQFAIPEVLPVALRKSQHVYLTFAGSMCNSVVAHWATDGEATATEFMITSPNVLMLEGLPTDPNQLIGHLDGFSVPDENLSPFQQALPVDLRRRELLNEWQRQPVHARLLSRLANARQVRMPTDLLDLVEVDG
jgi:ATP-dependent Lhr-like helicase